jgi:hypothetical protein
LRSGASRPVNGYDKTCQPCSSGFRPGSNCR